MNKNKNRGFTLLELLTVIAIIAILSTIAVVSVQAARKKARVAKAEHDIDRIVLGIKLMAEDTGEWPNHQIPNTNCGPLSTCDPNNEICSDGCIADIMSGVAGLMQNDPLDPYDNWEGPYMLSIPEDPWGNQYFIDTDYEHATEGWMVVVGSYGPDGIGNNQYNADDILKSFY